MADQKISELLAALALDGTELVPIVQGGITKQTTIGDIVAFGMPLQINPVSGSYALTGTAVTLTEELAGAGALIVGETNALAIDFTYDDNASKQMRVITASTPVDSDPASTLTYSSPSVKITRRANGLWTPTNGTTDLPYEWDAGGNPLGILVEMSRQNLALRASDFTNASWTKSNMTTSQTATGPDGVANSATILTASAGNATALQAITSASAERITSCFFKRRTGSGNIDLTQDNGSTWTTVAVTSSWARYQIAAVTSANPTVGIRIVTSSDAVDVALFQHELGAFISSPIQTVAAPVMRAADQFPNFSAFPIGATAHTLIFYGSLVDVNNSIYPIALDDGTTNNGIGLRVYFGNGNVNVAAGGSGQANEFAGSISNNIPFKIGVAVAANDLALVVDNGTPALDSTITVPTLTGLYIASLYPFASVGYVKQITYLARRASNSELQTRTT